jgi:hypothetical protein
VILRTHLTVNERRPPIATSGSVDDFASDRLIAHSVDAGEVDYWYLGMSASARAVREERPSYITGT